MPEPPVRIYKIIAFSFLTITVILLGFVVFSLFKKTEIIILAKENTRTVEFRVNAEVNASKGSLNAQVETQDFYWSETFEPTAVKKVDGLAKGTVEIINDSPQEMILIKTTRLLSANDILFRLADKYVVPAHSSITAQIYADESGEKSDIEPTKFTIPGLSLDTQKLVYAESKNKIMGGSGKIGIVGAEDINAAGQSFSLKMKEAFLQANNLTQANNVVVAILEQHTTSTHTIGQEATDFTIAGTSTIMTLTYNKEELNRIINQEINKKIEAGSEKILSTNENPVITVDNIDSVNQSAQLKIVTDALVTLDVNSTLLEKNNFINKTKAEIERYVISLPDVTGQDIRFTPSWITKTPSNPDKLKVIVKSTK
jgi:hypothetical protein